MHTEEQYKAIQQIHDLLADSRKEYEDASIRVPDERVQRLLHHISIGRSALEDELATDIRHHEPGNKLGDGTVGGTIHRALLTARDAINNTSEVNVLVECERQESDLLGHYDKVLDTVDLNETTRAVLAGQHAEIVKNVANVRQLRKELEAVEH